MSMKHPLEARPDAPVQLVNIDLIADRPDLLDSNTNHFNIEKNEKVHAEILQRLETVCPPRPVWAARRPPDRWTQATQHWMSTSYSSMLADVED